MFTFNEIFIKIMTLIGLLSVWFLYIMVLLNSGSSVYLDLILVEYPTDDFESKLSEFDIMVKNTDNINNFILAIKISIIITSIISGFWFKS